jgi:antitoxin (DNA-binding transcriptional repressor) of toxin-antitoxin stability system
MRIVSATQMSRSFSDFLDLIEREGDEFLITRHGRVVARLVPPKRTTGRELRAFLAENVPDAGWYDDVLAARPAMWPEL